MYGWMYSVRARVCVCVFCLCVCMSVICVHIAICLSVCILEGLYSCLFVMAGMENAGTHEDDEAQHLIQPRWPEWC